MFNDEKNTSQLNKIKPYGREKFGKCHKEPKRQCKLIIYPDEISASDYRFLQNQALFCGEIVMYGENVVTMCVDCLGKITMCDGINILVG